MTQITKTQVFSQIVDQKEHKNNWYKFGGSTSRFQPLPIVHLPLSSYSLPPPSQWQPLPPNVPTTYIAANVITAHQHTSIELLSSSVGVTSAKFHKVLVGWYRQTLGPIERGARNTWDKKIPKLEYEKTAKKDGYNYSEICYNLADPTSPSPLNESFSLKK